MKYTALAVVLGAAYASAQSLSSSCIATLTTLVAAPEFACLNAQALLPLASSSSQSIVGPVNQWLQGMCAQPACTNDVVSAAVANVTQGCQADLEAHALGTSGGALALVTPVVQLAYPTARQVACLQDQSDGNAFCATELLTSLQASVGPLTVAKLVQVAMGVQLTDQGLTGLPQNVTCSACVKQAYNLVDKSFPQYAAAAGAVLQSQCGAGFTDGATPAGIVEIASTASATDASKNSGERGLLSTGAWGVAASALVALFSAFVVLA